MNESKKLWELLGIDFCKNCQFEEIKPCPVCEQCAGIDFTTPENNQNLRDCIIKAGGSIGYEGSGVTIFFKYIDYLGIVKADDTYNNGLIDAISQLQISDLDDYKTYEALKEACQQVNWSKLPIDTTNRENK
jgi:hypothetical protein